MEQTRNRVSDRVSRRERGMSGLREEDERRESNEIKNLIFFFLSLSLFFVLVLSEIFGANEIFVSRFNI